MRNSPLAGRIRAGPELLSAKQLRRAAAMMGLRQPVMIEAPFLFPGYRARIFSWFARICFWFARISCW